jgi:hypothetical protein
MQKYIYVFSASLFFSLLSSMFYLADHLMKQLIVASNYFFARSNEIKSI